MRAISADTSSSSTRENTGAIVYTVAYLEINSSVIVTAYRLHTEQHDAYPTMSVIVTAYRLHTEQHDAYPTMSIPS